MGRVVRNWLGIIGGVVLMTGVAACTISQQEAPALQGPSEFALSLTLSVTPDVLSVDGVSQATITIRARDENGNPVASMTFRADISVAGVLLDCGVLSTHAPVAGGDGVAYLTYTAPDNSCGSELIHIHITPTGAGTLNDASNQLARTVGIRLVPNGSRLPGVPTANFKINGEDTNAATVDPFIDVVFDATCVDADDLACATAQFGAWLVSYDWSFGDGDTASGQRVLHQFNPGSYDVKLTVTDNNGLASTTGKTVSVGDATEPTANFVYSPSEVSVGTLVRFNGSVSASDPARTIVDWFWDFGDGGQAHGPQVTHEFNATGSYTVVLTVVDDKRQSGQTQKVITVGAGAPTAAFVFSPTAPGAGVSVNFNASTSTAVVGRTIVSYTWDFGDGSPAATGVTTSHPYAAPGTYTVVLTIVDSEGETATATATVPVT